MTTFTPPTKRAMGQCTCGGAPVFDTAHHPDCPSLHPLQPQPGDEPDALTRLTREVRALGEMIGSGGVDVLLALISEARDEQKGLPELEKRADEAVREALNYRSQCREVERQWEAALLDRDMAVTRAIAAERGRHAAEMEAQRLKEALENLHAHCTRLEARLAAEP